MKLTPFRMAALVVLGFVAPALPVAGGFVVGAVIGYASEACRASPTRRVFVERVHVVPEASAAASSLPSR